MKITSKQLRESWLKFYEGKGHVNVGAVSLIGDGSTGVMFNVAGMQPLMPYLLGKTHPAGICSASRTPSASACATCRDASERWISSRSATPPTSPSLR